MQYNNFESIILTDQFYKDYKNYTQILQKTKRPYILVVVIINDFLCAIPLRSNINVQEYKIRRAIKYGTFFHTENEERSTKKGLDFSKLIILQDSHYILDSTKLKDITQKNYIHSSKHIIESQLKKYIHTYKSKFMKLEAGNYHKEMYYYCATSSLQYFHNLLGLPESMEIIQNVANYLVSQGVIIKEHKIKIINERQ